MSFVVGPRRSGSRTSSHCWVFTDESYLGSKVIASVTKRSDDVYDVFETKNDGLSFKVRARFDSMEAVMLCLAAIAEEQR